MGSRSVVEFESQAMFGGCFQCVLDAACEAAEWLTSAVQFESAALRAVTRKASTKVTLTEASHQRDDRVSQAVSLAPLAKHQ